jgi:hypothetical protein
METELEQNGRNQCRATADDDGNVMQIIPALGQERIAGDPNFGGWLLDRLGGD